MLATLMTFAFLAAATFATGVICASLAKGFAAATILRRQLALGDEARTITVRHEQSRARTAVMARTSRRVIRPGPVLAARSRQRVAA